DPEQFRRQAHTLVSCYAYSLGYRAENGVIGPRFEADKPNFTMPIMADCPPPDPLVGNSRNHGGRGQNVLFQDGHVKFCSLRPVGVAGDDIYVNKAHRVAAGLDWADSALGSSAASPNP